MIDFIVASKDFNKTIRMVLAGRAEFSDKDATDIIARAGELEVCSTGTTTRIDAVIESAGYARVPIPVLKTIKRISSSFKQTKIRIRIEPGRIRVESFSYGNPDIELKPIGPRIADVPIDASPLDLMALQKLYSAEEIGDSGLAARVAEAQQLVSSALDSAEWSLKVFGIRRNEIRELVDASITKHAIATRYALLK